MPHQGLSDIADPNAKMKVAVMILTTIALLTADVASTPADDRLDDIASTDQLDDVASMDQLDNIIAAMQDGNADRHGPPMMRRCSKHSQCKLNMIPYHEDPRSPKLGHNDEAKKKKMMNLMMMRCCSGSCVDISRDAMNCGRCGHVCSSNLIASSSSSILCSAGRCIDTSRDPRNCGHIRRKCKYYCFHSMCDYGL
jgi:hypothetical protein